MTSAFIQDSFRYTGSRSFPLKQFLSSHAVRYLFFLRQQNPVARLCRKHMQTKYGLEIGNGNNIGPGLYLGHVYSITVNPRARLGKNCNLHKGVTIGQENRGKRIGAPVIGDNVWVGTNAVVVGGITVGDNVLIAPNAFVNQDIPPNSIVIGNPARTIPSPDATVGYINNPI